MQEGRDGISIPTYGIAKPTRSAEDDISCSRKDLVSWKWRDIRTPPAKRFWKFVKTTESSVTSPHKPGISRLKPEAMSVELVETITAVRDARTGSHNAHYARMDVIVVLSPD